MQPRILRENSCGQRRKEKTQKSRCQEWLWQPCECLRTRRGPCNDCLMALNARDSKGHLLHLYFTPKIKGEASAWQTEGPADLPCTQLHLTFLLPKPVRLKRIHWVSFALSIHPWRKVLSLVNASLQRYLLWSSRAWGKAVKLPKLETD